MLQGYSVVRRMANAQMNTADAVRPIVTPAKSVARMNMEVAVPGTLNVALSAIVSTGLSPIAENSAKGSGVIP